MLSLQTAHGQRWKEPTAKDGGVAQGCMEAFSQQSSIQCLLYYEGPRAAGQKHLCSFRSQLYPLPAHCCCIALPFCRSTQRLPRGQPCGPALEKGKALWILSAQPQLGKGPLSQSSASSVCGCDTCDSEHGARFVDTLGCAPLLYQCVDGCSVMHEAS